MAFEFDWVTLESDEEVIWHGKPHFYSIVPTIIVGIVLIVLVIGIFIIIWAVLWRRTTDYVVTTKGLYRKYGILSRNVTQIEYDKVQNISFNQDALGKHFGYGNVDISTAGSAGREMQFRAVSDPKSVQERINRQIRDTRIIDDEQERGVSILDDILIELRAIRRAIELSDGEGDEDLPHRTEVRTDEADSE